MIYAFNPNTWEAGAGGFCEFEAGLIYRLSSKTDRAIQCDLVSKTKTNKKGKQIRKLAEFSEQIRE